MISNTFSVNIEAVIQASQASLDNLKQQIKNLKPDTNAWKEMNRYIKEMTNSMTEMKIKSSMPIQGKSDIKSFEREALNIEKVQRRAQLLMQNVTFSDLKVPKDVEAQFDNFRKEMENAEVEYNATINRIKSDLKDAGLNEALKAAFGSDSTAEGFLKKSNFDSLVSYISSTKGKLDQQATQLKVETAQNYENAINAIKERLTGANFDQAIKTAFGDNAQTILDQSFREMNVSIEAQIKTFEEQLNELKSKLEANTNAANTAKSNMAILKGIQTNGRDSLNNGVFEGTDFAKYFLRNGKFNNTKIDIDGLIPLGDNENRKQQFLKALGIDITNEDIQKVLNNTKKNFITQLQTLFNKNDITSYLDEKTRQALSNDSMWSEQFNNLQPQLEAARQALATLKAELDNVNQAEGDQAAGTSKYETLTNKIQKAIQALDLLKGKSGEIDSATRELNHTFDAQAHNIEQLKGDLADKTRLDGEGREQTDALADAVQNFRQQLQNTSGAMGDFEQKQRTFNNLKMVVQNFMGFYQVLNLVRRAIREAVSTIKELDTVMNGIAIVSKDLNTEDLWGTVAQYSEVAQKYGVSIKGAYEVSKIYYQAGYDTNDVMTLMNETLKLSKVSGLDYATTTDYMMTA